MPLDRVPFLRLHHWHRVSFLASRIGTGCLFELSTLGTRLACILLIFRPLSAEFQHNNY